MSCAGVVDDEDTTSSEETSHRSDENLATRAVVNVSTAGMDISKCSTPLSAE